MISPTFVAVADHAVLVQFGADVSAETTAAVQTLDRLLAAAEIRGVIEVVPGVVDLLVDFDPLCSDHAAVEDTIRDLLAHPLDDAEEAERHVVEMCFDDDLAPDLDAVARHSEMDVEQVIRAHLDTTYRVQMYGFAPGYAYLTGLDERIRVPRKHTPVRGVAAGSVIVAGPQCLVTTLQMPTGWSVIGRSPTRILRPDAESPFLFAPGDLVDFVAIDRSALEQQTRDQHARKQQARKQQARKQTS